MSRLFRIYEEDLQRLEYSLPRLCDRAGVLLNDPEVQVIFAELKDIVSNIRWDYGPPSEVLGPDDDSQRCFRVGG